MTNFENYLKNNKRMSNSYFELGNMLLENKDLHNQFIPKVSDDIPIFMQNYPYEISPWPVIIDKDFVDDTNHILANIPEIFQKIVNNLALTNKSYLNDYLNIPDFFLDIYLSKPVDLRDVICRYDATMSGGILKLIELNIGLSLGGLDLDWFVPVLRRVLSENPETRDWQFNHTSGYGLIFHSVMESIIRLKGKDVGGNFLFFIPPTIEAEFGIECLEQLKQSLTDLFKISLSQHNQQGVLYFFTLFDEVELNSAGELYYQGNKLDTILLNTVAENQIPKSFFSLLESGSLCDKFFHPDSMRYSIFSNKLLFALVHEPIIKQQLTAEEQLMINTHIPWTTRLINSSVLWQGQEMVTLTFIRKYKDLLVIKKSVSMQGKDVMVGRSVEMPEWLAFFQKYNLDKDWLLQEYCDPDLNICADPINGLCLYRMVMGIFSVQSKFAGSFMRAIPATTGASIINAAQGASVFIVLEENAPRKRTITI
jgi:hypothetical protein